MRKWHKRGLAFLLALCLLGSSVALASTSVKSQAKMPFDDVAEDSWFHNIVWYVQSHNTMIGTGATTFQPQAPFTRAMAVATLFRVHHGRLAVAADVRQAPFTDVPTNAWFAPYVTWAVNAGVVSSTAGAAFDPNVPVPRREFAAMLWRYAQIVGANMTVPEDFSLQNFTDVGTLPAWALEPMRWAVYNGLLAGTSATTLGPQSALNRVQGATTIMRLMGNLFIAPPEAGEGLPLRLVAQFHENMFDLLADEAGALPRPVTSYGGSALFSHPSVEGLFLLFPLGVDAAQAKTIYPTAIIGTINLWFPERRVLNLQELQGLLGSETQVQVAFDDAASGYRVVAEMGEYAVDFGVFRWANAIAIDSFLMVRNNS